LLVALKSAVSLFVDRFLIIYLTSPVNRFPPLYDLQLVLIAGRSNQYMTTKVSRRPLHHGVLPYESSSRGDGTPTSLARSRNGQSRNTAAGKFPFQYLIIIAAFLMMLSWQLSQGHAHHFSRLSDSHEVPPMSLKPTNLPSLIGEPLLSSHPIMINVTDVDNAITIDARKAETTGLSSSSSIRVAYAISVTSCPSGNTTWTAVVDGPAVLAYSIQKLPSRYAHDLVAIVHPNATSCVDHLPRFGYKIIVKELGFKLREIKNKWSYRKYIKYQGCCEEFEFIKLEAFDLTDYDVVLHLDTDLLILQPMDGIVDAMMGFNKSAIDVLHKDRPLPGKITFLYTRDYVQMSRLSNETHKLAVQGGFFAVTPSHRLYRKLIKTVESGNFDMLAGWARKGYGGYYGAAQVSSETKS
jgi:hypothetical protein